MSRKKGKAYSKQRFSPDCVLDIPLTSNHEIQTPLRYPGGKSILWSFIATLIRNGADDSVYVEPYAGGAGIALRLLQQNVVSHIIINDFDPLVYAFWVSVVERPDDFLKRFEMLEPTIEEWHRQKEIIASPQSRLDQGVAFLFLNRTNRSGVITGGVIGGLSQKGNYRIDARYNKQALRKKITFIKENAPKITVCKKDGRALIREYAEEKNTFFYIDPPYVAKGKSLYMNAFSKGDHIELSSTLHEVSDSRWVLTYDDDPLIRSLYSDCFGGRYSLSYSALSRRQAEELIVFSNSAWPYL